MARASRQRQRHAAVSGDADHCRVLECVPCSRHAMGSQAGKVWPLPVPRRHAGQVVSESHRRHRGRSAALRKAPRPGERCGRLYPRIRKEAKDITAPSAPACSVPSWRVSSGGKGTRAVGGDRVGSSPPCKSYSSGTRPRSAGRRPSTCRPRGCRGDAAGGGGAWRGRHEWYTEQG